MSSNADLVAQCEEIRKNYSPCDVSDALLTLKVPLGGTLADISPLPSRHGYTNRLVAPISTVLFVPNAHQPSAAIPNLPLVPQTSNLPADAHFSDVAAPGTVVLMQQAPHQTAALLGDIVATRYKHRGIQGVFVDGRARDVIGIGEVCKADGKPFTAWTRSLSSSGTSAEAKPWAVDVPLQIGGVLVRPGDVLVADEGERVCCVIPAEKVAEVLALLPVQKEADDGLLADVKGGMGFKEALKRHPKHYTLQH